MKHYHHVFSKKRHACQSHLAKNLAPKNDREHFLKIAKEKIAALHEGNFARYRLRPGEFKNWLATVKHPNTKRPYTKMVCQPMLELLAYLCVNDFKIFIVSGGGIEFMHPWTERAYDIPPEQVIGSSIKTKFELRNGNPVPVRLPEINFIDDKQGKPVGINQHIGRRSIFAFGNSDGDLQMLQWTAAGQGPRFMGIVHHTDAEREWAYDRQSHIGRLNKALGEAKKSLDPCGHEK